MSFEDHFSRQSDVYAEARPTYPSSLFAFIASIAPAKERAWDCATGNGQAAIGLARHFAEVQATDASPQQIAHAVPHPRVVYSVQPAEATDFANASFDAVCVAQALHWFDHGPFFNEVRRVLKPGGVFVAWGYDWFRIDETIDAVIKRYLLDPIHPYWSSRNAIAWDGYKDVVFPFEPVDAPPIGMEFDWDFEKLMRYTKTWSATRKYTDEHGDDLLKTAEQEIGRVWGPPGRARHISMRTHILAGRRSA